MRLFILFNLIFFQLNLLWASEFSSINTNAGVMLCTEKGNILCSQNANKKFIPASTLKVLTTLSARHYLGDDYHFKTEFFIDNNSKNRGLVLYPSNINLKVKGYGDPLFTSIIIRDACLQLSSILKSMNIVSINDIVVDNTFFDSNINIDGKSETDNPYDAFVGALSANFNTVAFKYSKDKRCYISDDPETPLLPFVMNRVQSSGLKRGRVILSEQESRVYAGILIKYFLSQQGIKIEGQVREGSVKRVDTAVYTFISPYDMDEIAKRLLEYSSNFIANQLFLSAGAQAFSPPATVEKGIAAMTQYAKQVVGISASAPLNLGSPQSGDLRFSNSNLVVAEGSGLSRKNRISPSDMVKVLKKFKSDYHLMKSEQIESNKSVKVSYSGINMSSFSSNGSSIGSNSIAIGGKEYYKTGTLNGVRTRCGYFETPYGLYPFVIMVNESGTGYDKIRQFLWKRVLSYERR